MKYLCADNQMKFLPQAYTASGLETLRQLADSMGEMPNIEMKTMGGHMWWDTILEVDGWRLQVNRLFGNARILDENDVRVAWGSEEAMFSRLTELMKGGQESVAGESILKPGDIIGIKRPLGYEHYAVYIGGDRVIHYADDTGDFGTKVVIHEADMSEFLLGQRSFFILDFPDSFGAPQKIYLGGQGGAGLERSQLISMILNLSKSSDYKLYSPEETIERARSRLGEDKYDLAFNNCEHFAIWCKTGMHESYQADAVIKLLRLIMNIPMTLTEGQTQP